jgi:ankyrin repeat protein
VLRLLLDRGADPNAVTGPGISALVLATLEGLRAEAKLLLERGADPNLTTHITGASALIYAASHGDDELVRLLLNRGADPNHKRQAGQTAADVAREQGFEDIARMLEERMRAPSISETPGSDR